MGVYVGVEVCIIVLLCCDFVVCGCVYCGDWYVDEWYGMCGVFFQYVR